MKCSAKRSAKKCKKVKTFNCYQLPIQIHWTSPTDLTRLISGIKFHTMKSNPCEFVQILERLGLGAVDDEGVFKEVMRRGVLDDASGGKSGELDDEFEQ